MGVMGVVSCGACNCTRDNTKETTFEPQTQSMNYINGKNNKSDVSMTARERSNMTTTNTAITENYKNNSKIEYELSNSAVNENYRKSDEELYKLIKIVRIQRGYRKFKVLKNKNKVEDTKTPMKDSNAGKARFSLTGNNNFEYIGNKVSGQKEGFGKQVWKDGAVYRGMFKQNKASGWGQFKHSDGDDYQGEFTNDRACGYGIYLHTNTKAVYEGEWKDDNQEGIGCEIWNDKSSFIGIYEKGKKQGIGSYQWADGSRYEGEWKDNSLHGYGIYYFTDDKIYIGNWINNSMNGYGEFYWKDGKRYAGFYVNDRKEGFGIYYWSSPNQRAFVGFWKNGKQDGVGKYINSNNTRFGYWQNGERTKWFNTDEDAIINLLPTQQLYTNMFKYSLNNIMNFLNK